jgi:isopenicillin-N epimerase
VSALPRSAPAFGHPARALFSLAAEGTFLNHGSYGAVPRVVQAAQRRLQEELENNPDAFFARIEPNGQECAPRQVAAVLARLTGTTAERIALVENTTAGIEAVLDSFPLQPGDEVLLTDQQYNAVRLGTERRCRAVGAIPRIASLPLPATPGAVVQAVLDAIGPSTRLAVLDHICSGSAMVLPLEQIIPELRRRGVAVAVDGAHAIGQIPLDLPALGADWYVTNAHKWLYAPRGAAMLWSSAEAPVQPLPGVTSHYIGYAFPKAFDYTGTRDYTAWLSTPEAVRFFEACDPRALWSHEAALVDAGTQSMLEAGGLPVAAREMCAAMRAFVLPQRRAALPEDAEQLIRTLWEAERIRIRCTTQDGKLLLRFSGQAYVALDDLRNLGESLQRHGWPGRA